MAFIVPLVAAAGTAIGSAGAAIGTAIGSAGSAIGGLLSSGATAGGILGTGLNAWQALSLGGSIFSGVAQYGAAQAQSAAYQLQATNALIQGNQQAQEYQRQGIAVLNRTIETKSLIAARGGAGGIDPFSGSAQTLSDYAMSKGVDEYNWARSNTEMAIMSGQANQASYMAAADSASRMGMFNLIGSGLMGGARLKALA